MLILSDTELSSDLCKLSYDDLRVLLRALNFFILHSSQNTPEAERLYINLYDYNIKAQKKHDEYINELMKRLINSP